jgi:hypothetical protein
MLNLCEVCELWRSRGPRCPKSDPLRGLYTLNFVGYVVTKR